MKFTKEVKYYGCWKTEVDKEMVWLYNLVVI